MSNFCESGKLELRKINDLRPVLFSQQIVGDQIVYEICRSEKETSDLRYDLTIIHDIDLSGEFAKTFGHYHINNFPEIYEVLNGKAWFFLQKYNNDLGSISEAYLIEANSGDKVVIPMGFGMTTINSDLGSDLMLGNWVSKNVQNDYAFYQKLHGACYYFLKNQDGEFNAVENSNYQQIPELIKLKPKNISKELENLEFLSNPEKYKDLLTINNLYERI